MSVTFVNVDLHFILLNNNNLYLNALHQEDVKKKQTSREVRSENRRLQAAIALFQENLEVSDLLKFNQLKVFASVINIW